MVTFNLNPLPWIFSPKSNNAEAPHHLSPCKSSTISRLPQICIVSIYRFDFPITLQLGGIFSLFSHQFITRKISSCPALKLFLQKSRRASKKTEGGDIGASRGAVCCTIISPQSKVLLFLGTNFPK